MTRPTDSCIAEYLLAQRDQPYSYAEVGATNAAVPPGYNVDSQRVLLGYGKTTFAAARHAVRAWKMFPPEMARLCFPDQPISPGSVVGVLCHAAGLWSLHSARIVYVIDETVPTSANEIERFGFAYGTLPDHAERGEERFLVEWNRADDSVWYDILAFSRPNHLLAKLAYPYARHLQRRFRELSGQSMQRAVTNG